MNTMRFPCLVPVAITVSIAGLAGCLGHETPVPPPLGIGAGHNAILHQFYSKELEGPFEERFFSAAVSALGEHVDAGAVQRSAAVGHETARELLLALSTRDSQEPSLAVRLREVAMSFGVDAKDAAACAAFCERVLSSSNVANTPETLPPTSAVNAFRDVYQASARFWRERDRSTSNAGNPEVELRRSSWVRLGDALGGLIGSKAGAVGAIVLSAYTSIYLNETLPD